MSREVEKKGDGFIAVTRDTRKLKVRCHGRAILENRVTVLLQNLINRRLSRSVDMSYNRFCEGEHWPRLLRKQKQNNIET